MAVSELTVDEKIRRKAKELAELVEPGGIVVGKLTVHFHQAEPVRTEVHKSVRITGRIDVTANEPQD